VSKEHVIDPRRVHHSWDGSLGPSLVIDPGDIVSFELAMAGSGQVDEGSSIDDTRFDFDTLYNLLGPVWVNGAEPGDTLQIEILDLTPGDWGWTVVLAGLGLLAEDFPDPFLRTFDLRKRSRVEVAPGARVAIEPFLGTMGTHPGEPIVAPPFPPHRGGGNIDNRHLTRGATLWLPVWCDGALFSCGDPHAAQGDGEVCVSAIECDMRAVLRFGLLKRPLEAPAYLVPARSTARDRGAYFGTMGIGPNLFEGAKAAVRAMIGWLGEEHGIGAEDAYILSSLAGDLHIHEIVDAGVWNVGFTLPLSTFEVD
jgi:acetamidase/formamidase